MDMEEFNRRRAPLRRRFQRSEKRLTELYESAEVDRDAIDAEYRFFKNNFTTLIDLDRNVMDMVHDTEMADNEKDEELDLIDDYQIRAERLQVRWEKLTIPPTGGSDARSVQEEEKADSNLKSAFKLPQIRIRPFSGKLTDWLGFWAQFSKIHDNGKLTDSDKLYYLLQYLEPGSEPYQIAGGYPLSNENYVKVIEVFKKRYGDEDLLLQVYLRELLGLIVANVTMKEKMSLPNLHLKLDTHLRALRSLNLEKADPATWLFPLVESSLPDQVLRDWQRDPLSKHDGSGDNPPRTRLDLLLQYVENEVQIQQRIKISHSFAAGATRSIAQKETKTPGKPSFPSKAPSTVGTFHSADTTPCVFCGKKNHKNEDCYRAQNWSSATKREILKKKGLCFSCFGSHLMNNCDANLKCWNCEGNHYTILCVKGGKRKNETDNLEHPPKQRRVDENMDHAVNLISQTSSQVFLPTVMVKVWNGSKSKNARALIDSGSQRSYLLSSTAKTLGLVPTSQETVIHSVFGGHKTGIVTHNKFKVKVGNLQNNFETNVEVRDEIRICGDVPRISQRHNVDVIDRLQKLGISLTDVGDGTPTIELLLGADVYFQIRTGMEKAIGNGMVAVKTKLGWAVMGESKLQIEESFAHVSLSLTIADSKLPNLWDMETLGIRDELHVDSAQQMNMKVKENFIRNLTRLPNGRYEVALPWKPGVSCLPTNKEVATKRLYAATRKLKQVQLFEKYGELFLEWEKEGFVEKVNKLDNEHESVCHYLPHRPVIKKSSLTTPVRPVFDASCKVRKSPSLNECLHTGENLLKLIPDVLLRFREKPVAFTSDIRKAFQMVGIRKEDRDFLRFLWWNETEKELVEYRHVRVPFGATCSPFILGAVLEYHLTNLAEKYKETGIHLLQSMYVDNCLSSVETAEEYQIFRKESIELLAQAKMNLRMWYSNVEELDTESVVPVLGLLWNRKYDFLSIDVSKLILPELVSKRSVLSTVQKIFDPIGFTAPATVPLKNMLQRAWIKKLKWDEPFPDEEKASFLLWMNQVKNFEKIHIPRNVTGGISARKNWSFHTFTDASQYAYGAVVYLRAECDGMVSVQLVSAKSRVAPVEKGTIPRLELLGCLIGARLTAAVLKGFDIKESTVPKTFWTDSMTALAWIQRGEQWGTFVGNRVKEINILTEPDQWRHIPGRMNPADLPSRGCFPEELFLSKWWEGPKWLYECRESWPGTTQEANEDEIGSEKKRTVAVSMTCLESTRNSHSFHTMIRITGWIRRFFLNLPLRFDLSTAKSGELSKDELHEAEIALIRSIQQESFPPGYFDSSKHMQIILHADGVLRVKTKLIHRDDTYTFRFPAILPGRHPVIRRLIHDMHLGNCHAGVGYLVTLIRENYWITHARKSVKSVLSNCYRCGRYTAKPTVTESSALPEDRVKDAAPFEVTGVDLAGPLLLRNQKKVWMVLFTCGTYRAVHLELVDSLSTAAFLKAMKKFVWKYGRPSVIYSDNGTNFHGADNIFKNIDWNEVKEEETFKRITWKFNPSLASWFGGFFERMIRTTKDLMRRIIGKGSLHRHELEEVISAVEEVINGRPLTYISEDPEDLSPLTPAHFLNPLRSVRFPEADLAPASKLRMRYNYLQTIRKQLKDRWRKEYLAMLIAKPVKATRPLRIGELVIVSNDSKKRVEWNMARILDLIPGTDGVSRVAKIRTEDGEFTRPVQRLHPLEVHDEMDKEQDMRAKEIKTRSGRVVRPPAKFQ